MNLYEFIPPEQIFLDAALGDKDDVLRFTAKKLAELGIVKSQEGVYRALRQREDMMSTGIGDGIGIPHALTPEVEHVAILLIRPEKPVPFDALDRQPVCLVIPLIVPENETTLHLRMIASIAGMCRTPGFTASVKNARSATSLWNDIRTTMKTAYPSAPSGR